MIDPLTRRTFLARTGACAGAITLARSLSTIAPARAAPLSMTEIAPGVFVHQGRHETFSPENAGDVANLAVIAGKDSLAVVDTGGSAIAARNFLEAIRKISGKPIRYVINTHMHPDHVFGNAVFQAEKPIFVAHHKMARGLAARADHYLQVNKDLLGAASFEGVSIVMPTEFVTDRTELDLGDRKLTLVARPTAHTDNDLTVFDNATKTLILGDLLFSGHIPALDGSIAGWLAVMEALKNEKADRAVPGHGPASMPWPDALLAQERYLRAIAADVRSMIKQNKTLKDALQTAGQSEKDQWLLADQFHARNVTAAFAELEWE